jgi:Helicase HerA, central domain
MREPALKQKTRFILLLVDVAILCVASWIAFGSAFPPDGEKGFWFYVALLGLVLGSRLDTPFFAVPADVVLYAAPAAIALALANSWAQWDEGVRVAYCVTMAFCIFAGLLGATAILTMDTKSEKWQRASNAARILAETLGAPRTIYSVVIGFALFAFHTASPKEFGVIIAAWVLTAVLSPLEGSVRIWRRLRRIFKPNTVFDADGEVIAYQTPSRMLIRKSNFGKINSGDVVAVHDLFGQPKLALVLDHFGRDEGILLRAVEIPELPTTEENTSQLSALPSNAVVNISNLENVSTDAYLLKCKSSIVGLVAENTSINKLYVDVIEGAAISEGMVLEVAIQDSPVLYQITDGLTQEKAVFQKNTRGFAQAEARKIGRWNADKKTFQLAKWIPDIHSPVFQTTGPDIEIDETAIGCLPATKYPVRLKDIHELVTHNTAILGILGVGKSILAIELVERMIAEGIKIVCLDLTNQYAEQLAAFYDSAKEERCIEQIRLAGDKDRDNVEDSKAQGGSFDNLQKAIRDDLAAFLNDDCKTQLKIYNPAQLSASVQYGDLRNKKIGPGQNDWQAVAAFRETTPAEITRIVAESCLTLVQDAMRDNAKVCLIFEEAHSLVPEFGNLTVESDKHAVAGTARAILQGRKYGMGCLIISQRTANVTKTILNQCNTIFAFRTFDDTGMAFLENYLGHDYAHVLPSLEERHVVFFGKASSCENPVLMRVNDRNNFLTRFRAKHPPMPLASDEETPAPAPPVELPADPTDDGVPF